MKIKSILSTLLLMVCTVTSAQKYLNVLLEDGTYRSFKATPNMEISFDKTAKQTGYTIVVNGYQVTIVEAPDVMTDDVLFKAYLDDDNVKIDACPKSGKVLTCTVSGKKTEVSVENNYYTFTISNITSDVVATIGYSNTSTPSVEISLSGSHMPLNNHPIHKSRQI